jgi:CBS domain-containing protein
VAEDDRVVGLVGERDIVLAVADHAESITSLKVRDIMEKQPVTCSPDDPIMQVMDTMTRKRRRHIPVVDGGHLCGIVSIGDMVKFRLNQMDLETRVLRDAYLTKH